MCSRLLRACFSTANSGKHHGTADLLHLSLVTHLHLTLVTCQVVVRRQTVRRVRIVYTSTLPIQLVASQSLDKLTLVVISGGFESRISFHTETQEDGGRVARY